MFRHDSEQLLQFLWHQDLLPSSRALLRTRTGEQKQVRCWRCLRDLPGYPAEQSITSGPRIRLWMQWHSSHHQSPLATDTLASAQFLRRRDVCSYTRCPANRSFVRRLVPDSGFPPWRRVRPGFATQVSRQGKYR